jgi:hypothetical protein
MKTWSKWCSSQRDAKVLHPQDFFFFTCATTMCVLASSNQNSGGFVTVNSSGMGR